MTDLNGEYQLLASEQEQACAEEQKARERVEELDRRHYTGDTRVTPEAVQDAGSVWLEDEDEPPVGGLPHLYSLTLVDREGTARVCDQNQTL